MNVTSPDWLIPDASLKSRDEAYLSILHNLSNGLLGARASSPFAPRGAQGSIFGGVHAEVQAALSGIPALGSLHRDSVRFPDDSQVFRMSAFDLPSGPNLFALRLRVNRQTVRIPWSLSRSLDIRHGVLTTQARLAQAAGDLEITVTRFASLSDVRLVLERIEIIAHCAADIELGLDVDATVLTNISDFWEERRGQVHPDGIALWQAAAGGTSGRVAVAIATAGPGKTTVDAGRYALCCDHRFSLKSGDRAVIDRVVSAVSSVHDPDPAAAAREACADGLAAGFDAALTAHRASWDAFWQENDIRIDGNSADQQALRFCLFQLRSAVPPPPGRFSIGPNFLAGGRYRACVFWDTDVYIMPYMVRTMPEVARRHLVWRHASLPAARDLARERFGMPGARYPWQAMADGREALGPWNIFAPNQVHIVGDVAWLAMEYHAWTGDDEFMRSMGAEILAETARFWAGRITRTSRGCELRDVCGPDETHPTVHNNVYTNILARENLRWAARWSLDTPAAERNEWRAIADRLVILAPNAGGVIPQSEGFLDLPEPPPGVGCIDGDKYQSVKQADLLMLPVMFPGIFPDEVIRANYRYYEPRTTHESSLSPGAHAIVAARLGMSDETCAMFRRTAHIDYGNTHGNSHKGLHSACTGLAPRVVMEGFAGLQLREGAPVLAPHLPAEIPAVSFRFACRGKRYRCEVTAADNGRTLTPAAEG